MKRLDIAELNSHLSKYFARFAAANPSRYLRARLRSRRSSRRQPTALKIRRLLPGALALNRVPLPETLKTGIDIVDRLLEERQSHR